MKIRRFVSTDKEGKVLIRCYRGETLGNPCVDLRSRSQTWTSLSDTSFKTVQGGSRHTIRESKRRKTIPYPQVDFSVVTNQREEWTNEGVKEGPKKNLVKWWFIEHMTHTKIVGLDFVQQSGWVEMVWPSGRLKHDILIDQRFVVSFSCSYVQSPYSSTLY